MDDFDKLVQKYNKAKKREERAKAAVAEVEIQIEHEKGNLEVLCECGIRNVTKNIEVICELYKYEPAPDPDDGDVACRRWYFVCPSCKEPFNLPSDVRFLFGGKGSYFHAGIAHPPFCKYVKGIHYWDSTRGGPASAIVERMLFCHNERKMKERNAQLKEEKIKQAQRLLKEAEAM